MKKIAIIPARYASVRFPGKLMQSLGNKTVILTTYEAVTNSRLFDQVYVVCDSEIIFDEIIRHGGNALMSKNEHASGTDRVAEAVKDMPLAEVIVNVQGDEPFIQRKALKDLLQVFEEEKNLGVASLMHTITDPSQIQDPNNVKVVTDRHSMALLFSRSVIPYHRNKEVSPVYYKHIGIYAFRRETLLSFARLPQSPLEKAEQLEGNRYLEYGIKMKMVLSEKDVVGIDTPADLDFARKMINNKI